MTDIVSAERHEHVCNMLGDKSQECAHLRIEIERLREALADLIEQADRGRHDEIGLFRACERARKALEGTDD